MTKKSKLKRKDITKVISIFVIILAIAILINVFKNVYQMVKLKQQAQLVEAELKILEDENASLTSTRDKLEDPNYVETYARGEYMFSKGDEKVFYLPGSEEE